MMIKSNKTGKWKFPEVLRKPKESLRGVADITIATNSECF